MTEETSVLKREDAYLRSSHMYVDHEENVMPRSLPARALKRLCAVVQSAIPATAGAIRTKASSPTSLLFSFSRNRYV